MAVYSKRVVIGTSHQPHAARLVGVTSAGVEVDGLVADDGSTSISPLAGEETFVMRTRQRTTAYVLSVTTAVTVGAGASGDAILEGILILATAVTAATATLTGFGDQAGVAASILLTGSTTQDVWHPIPGWLNSVGALTVTASVANKVVVSWTAR